MHSVPEKKAYLLETKARIAAALARKGVTLAEDAPFRDYATAVERIVPNTDIRYQAYLGTEICAENSLNGATQNLEIRGNTYHNLQDTNEGNYSVSVGSLTNGIDYTIVKDGYDLTYTRISENTPPWIYFKMGLCANMSLKPNTTYTVIAHCTNIRFISLRDSNGSNIISASAYLTNGYVKSRLTTTDYDEIGAQIFFFYCEPSATTTAVSDLMILEGDYTEVDLPAMIHGIESVQGALCVTSHNANLLDLSGAKTDTNSDNGIATTLTADGASYDADAIDYPHVTLHSLPDGTCDCVKNNVLTQRVGTRDYAIGDETRENVTTDFSKTLYALTQPLETPLDMLGQAKQLKTFETMTYLTISGSNIPPKIAVEIPTPAAISN